MATKADAQFGIPTVENNPNKGSFIGIVSNARTIVEPTIDSTGAVTRQGIVLLTVRNGATKLMATVGTAYLGAIDAFKQGIIDQSIELDYELCVKGKTTYSDDDGLHYHGIDGNRTLTLEPISTSAYMESRMEAEKQSNLAMLQAAGADMSALVAYLRG